MKRLLSIFVAVLIVGMLATGCNPAENIIDHAQNSQPVSDEHPNSESIATEPAAESNDTADHVTDSTEEYTEPPLRPAEPVPQPTDSTEDSNDSTVPTDSVTEPSNPIESETRPTEPESDIPSTSEPGDDGIGDNETPPAVRN